MTSIVFSSIIVIGAVLIFAVVSFSMMMLSNNDTVGWISGTIAAALFVVIFANLTPSSAQLVENDYYAMMEDRPKCIDNGDTSL